MKEYRKVLQFVFLGIVFVTYRKLTYGPLKITLFVILISIVVQQFLFIFNSEMSGKNSKFSLCIKNDIVRSILILLLQIFLVFIIYVLAKNMIIV